MLGLGFRGISVGFMSFGPEFLNGSWDFVTRVINKMTVLTTACNCTG